MGEVTEQEIVDIANNFLLSSPPGEFMEVVTGKQSWKQSVSKTYIIAIMLWNCQF